MIEAYRRLRALPEPQQTDAFSLLNRMAAGKVLPRHTFSEIDEDAKYIKDYGQNLTPDELESCVLGRKNDIERQCLYALLNCRSKEQREDIYKKYRAKLHTSARLMNKALDQILDAIPEKELYK